MILFTTDQQALVDEWLATEADTIKRIDDAIATALAEKTKVELEDSIYLAEETEALVEQLELLGLKATALEVAIPDPDSDSANELRTVELLAGHPSNGGTNPAAWDVYYMATDLALLTETKTIEYSHTVNWDNDPDLLHQEYIWTVFNDWRHNPQYGTLPRLSGLDNAVVILEAQRAAILARNGILRENV